MIYLDTETTGLSDADEIVEIAIVDDLDNVLLNTLICPINIESWPEAQKIHGITPEMVKNFPTIISYAPVIKEILHDQDLVIYNSQYDMKYLRFAEKEPKNIHCAMVAFMEMYGAKKWQRLEFAASYCGYTFEGSAHRALADAKAARAVWQYISKRRG